jgi:hypothetical protein
MSSPFALTIGDLEKWSAGLFVVISGNLLHNGIYALLS